MPSILSKHRPIIPPKLKHENIIPATVFNFAIPLPIALQTVVPNNIATFLLQDFHVDLTSAIIPLPSNSPIALAYIPQSAHHTSIAHASVFVFILPPPST